MSSRGSRVWLTLLLGCGVPLWAPCAAAHLLNMSRVAVDLLADGQLRIVLELDLTRALGGAEAYFQSSQVPDPLESPALRDLVGRVGAATELRVGGRRVELRALALEMPDADRDAFLSPLAWPRAVVTLEGTLAFGADLSSSGVAVRFLPSFAFEEPIALTVRDTADDRTLSRWLVVDQTSPAFAAGAWIGDASLAAPDRESTAHLDYLWRYLKLGYRHILPSGYDHLLFVFGLLLGARSLRALLSQVAMYTLAHSLTLAAASLRWIAVPGAWVEPAITLSIAWVALDNARSQEHQRWRLLVIFGFGLFHGLGFSGALTQSGLPPGAVLSALAGFNLGVEAGQLAFIAVALLPLAAIRGRSWYRAGFVLPASVAVALIALVWTGLRLT